MKKTLTPVQAIKQYCLQCCLDSAREVSLCTVPDCPLYPFRKGKNPRKKRELSEEQKAAIVARFAKAKAEAEADEWDDDDDDEDD